MTESHEPDRLNSIDITIEGAEDLSTRPWNGPSPHKMGQIGGAGTAFSLESCNTLIVNDEDVTILPWRHTVVKATERPVASTNSQSQSKRGVSGSRHGSFRLDMIESVAVVAFFENKITTDEGVLEIRAQLDKLINEGHIQILLNFRDVHYISSSMLGTLTSLKRRVESLKGRLKMCCIGPNLLEAFRISRLEQVFEIYADELSALEST